MSDGATYRATSRQVSSTVDGEAVILHMDEGIYFGLNEVGTHVWGLLREGPRSLAELCDAVTEEFEVEPERAEADLVALLSELEQQGLAEAGDAGPPK